MNKKLLVLSILSGLMAQSAMAAEQNRAISYLTSWGLVEKDAATLEKSKVDTFLLSFGKWDAQGNIETSDGIASVPEYNAWWMPSAYVTWTQVKQADPDKKVMLAFGGQTYESIWADIDTPEKREVVANGLANLLKKPFPVYKKNLTADEMEGECLHWNWDNTQCDMATYQRAGTVYLDGIDFDFEKAARLTEKENEDLVQLATRLRQLIGKDKLLSLTTYHVGADPVNCADSSVLENCSYIEDKRSSHNGEVLPLLQQSKDIFDFFNVMAYDAGPNFLWKTAMNNYGNAVGDKSKVILGTTINSQWGPDSNFVETKENNLDRARWQKQQGFGGFFTWNLGASTESLTVAQQAAYIDEMKSAADGIQVNEEDIKDEDIKDEDIKDEDIKDEDIKDEDIKDEDVQDEGIKLSGVLIGRDSITVMMPEETYKGQNNIVLYVNGKYVAQSYNGKRYYSWTPASVAGQAGFSATPTLKTGDVVEVRLMSGTPGKSKDVLKSLYKETVKLAPVSNVKLSSVKIDSNKITVMMPEETYKGQNNIALYVNGKYVAQSFNGKRYYSYAPSGVAGQAGFYAKPTLKTGDKVEVRLMGGVPGGSVGILNVLYSATVK